MRPNTYGLVAAFNRAVEDCRKQAQSSRHTRVLLLTSNPGACGPTQCLAETQAKACKDSTACFVVTTHPCEWCIAGLGIERAMMYTGCVSSCLAKVFVLEPPKLPLTQRCLPTPNQLREPEMSSWAKTLGQAFQPRPVDTSGTGPAGVILHAETMDYIPAGSISGRVAADTTGDLLEGVSVTVYAGQSMPCVTGASHAGAPSGNNYVIGGLAVGSYRVVFTKPGYADEAMHFKVREGVQAVLPDAWMKEATVVISGKVVDENDQALAGSVVQVRGNGLCWELETDEAGAWSMETTAGLSLECTARCKGYIAKQFSCDSAGDYVSQLKPDDIVITGRVIDAASGMALPGAGVVAQHGTVLQQCSALQDGTFQFCFQATPTMDPVLAAVLPGYSRHIHSPGALFGGSTVHVGDLPLQLAPATVRGSLCHARTGQALAGLKLAAVDEAQVLWEGASDEAGSFSAVLPPQASGSAGYRLIANEPLFHPVTVTLPRLGPGEEVLVPALELDPVPAHLQGYVADATTGELLPNVRGSLVNADPDFVTEENGYFRAEMESGLPATLQFRSADPNQYYPATSTVPPLKPGQLVSIETVRMEPKPGFICGQVLDEDSRIGINQAQVIVSELATGTGANERKCLQVEADAHGHYRAGPLPAHGMYKVSASRSSCESRHLVMNGQHSVQLAPGEELNGANIFLPELVALHGTVTELELQHKLKGVAVVVRTRDQSRRGESEEVNSTTTRSDGSYSLLLRSGRDYAVSFSLPGYEETSFEQVAVPAASSLKLDATLRQTDGILAGRTFDADTDSLLPGVLVSVLKDCNIVYQCSSDDKGCYCLNVRPNSYELRFSCDPTYDPKGVRGAAVSPGAKLLTDVALQQREGSIAGKVIDGETKAALDNVAVQLKDATGAVAYQTMTAGDGTFARKVRPGRDYTLHFSRESYEDAAWTGTGEQEVTVPKPVKVTPAEEKQLKPQKLMQLRAKLSGTVRDQESQDPLEGVLVEVRDSRTHEVVKSVLSDARGRWRAEGVPPNRSYVIWQKREPHYEPGEVRGGAPNVSCGEDRENLDGALRQHRATISGTVDDATFSSRLSGVKVLALAPSQATIFATAYTDSRGVYSMQVPPGVCVIKFTRAQYESGYFRSTTSTPRVKYEAKPLTLLPQQSMDRIHGLLQGKPGRIEGTARAADTSNTLQGVIVQLEDPESSSILGVSARTDANGNYILGPVYPNYYKVKFSGHGRYDPAYHGGVEKVQARRVQLTAEGNLTGINGKLPPKKCELTGRVVDSDTGSPLQGVQVTTSSRPAVRTDSSGRFTIPGCDSGRRYNLGFQRHGYYSSSAGPYEFARPGERKNTGEHDMERIPDPPPPPRGGNQGGNTNCFPAGSLVLVQGDSGNQQVPVQDLVPGSTRTCTFDLQSGSIAPDGEVLLDCHETQEDQHVQVADFLEVWHQSEAPLRLSENHSLFVEHLDFPIPACKLREGDCIWRMQNGSLVPSRVCCVKRVKASGVYAPITPSTRLIVQGVAVSCLVVHSDAHAGARGQSTWLCRHAESIFKAAMIPLRLYRCLPASLRLARPCGGQVHPYARALISLADPLLHCVNHFGKAKEF